MTLDQLDRLVPISFAFVIALVATYFFVDALNAQKLIEFCIRTHGPDAQVCISLVETLYD